MMSFKLFFYCLAAAVAGSLSSCRHEPSVAPGTAPTSLVYSPNSLVLTQGMAGSSGLPVVPGPMPITYALSGAPAAAGLTINAGTGVISASDQVPVGTYPLSVTATNAVGSTVFANAFTLTVGAAAITFAAHVRPLVVSHCGGCHTGGAFTNYTVYANAAANIASILDRVQRAPGTPGYMPPNRPPLTAGQVAILRQWQTQGLRP